MRRAAPLSALLVALVAAAGVAACQGCHGNLPPSSSGGVAEGPQKPTIRLYVVSTVAGAMLGALVMQSLQSGMVLMGLDTPLQNIVVGLVLVVAVWLDRLYRSRTLKGSAA